MNVNEWRFLTTISRVEQHTRESTTSCDKKGWRMVSYDNAMLTLLFNGLSFMKIDVQVVYNEAGKLLVVIVQEYRVARKVAKWKAWFRWIMTITQNHGNISFTHLQVFVELIERDSGICGVSHLNHLWLELVYLVMLQMLRNLPLFLQLNKSHRKENHCTCYNPTPTYTHASEANDNQRYAAHKQFRGILKSTDQHCSFLHDRWFKGHVLLLSNNRWSQPSWYM